MRDRSAKIAALLLTAVLGLGATALTVRAEEEAGSDVASGEPGLAPPTTDGPCHGIVRHYVRKDGTERLRLFCTGFCDAAADGTAGKCSLDRAGNNHGGVRVWCDCDRDGKEPEDCHPVLYTPGKGEGGGPAKVLCAGICPNSDPTVPPEVCMSQIINRGELPNGGIFYDETCECVPRN